MKVSIVVSLVARIAFSLIQVLAFSLINPITGKAVMRPKKGEEGKFLPLLALLLTMKVLRKGVIKIGRRCNNINHMYKKLQFCSLHLAISRLLRIPISNLGLVVIVQETIYRELKVECMS